MENQNDQATLLLRLLVDRRVHVAPRLGRHTCRPPEPWFAERRLIADEFSVPVSALAWNDGYGTNRRRRQPCAGKIGDVGVVGAQVSSRLSFTLPAAEVF